LPTPIDRSLLDKQTFVPGVMWIPTWLQIAASDFLRNHYDRDDDGLTDWMELLQTATDPWHPDSDDDGLGDAYEDPDGDGLNNLTEVANGTDPLLDDTDGDLLSDSAEAAAGTNPLLADSDHDGLTDDSELRLGTNPTNADSNNNGLPDGQEFYTTQTSAEQIINAAQASAATTDSHVSVTGIGDIAKHIEVRDFSNDPRFQELAGQVGSAVRVLTDQPFATMQVKLPYRIAQVPGGDVAGIEILRFDEVALRFDHIGRIGNDGTHVWADSTQGGIFVPIHMPTWQAHWAAAVQTVQSAANSDFDDDTDGDGLLDLQESIGFLRSDGTVVTTDPNLWDTDGDGLSDAEEIGEYVTSGSHYTVPTEPNLWDTDGDELSDSEELGHATNPRSTDTDGDTLSDLIELNAGFDPLHSNPDGDYRLDSVEYEKGSDPFYFNPTRLIAGRIVLQGFILGDAGENLVEWGWIREDTFASFYYISGWLGSGFLAVGDVRDTVASAVRLDVVDTIRVVP
jgi:hypothetical protein